MASLAEFLQLLDQNVDRAFRDYVFNVDSASMDGDISQLQACTARDVGFEFRPPNVIVLRAAREGDAWRSEMWYLPWMYNGASKAYLTGEGPAYFSTSQLDGCRFTVQYDDANRKKATVFHLAGSVGHQKSGSLKRDEMALAAGLKTDLPEGRTRSYSISSGVKPKFERIGEHFKLQYSGNKAWVFGLRDDAGAWTFYAQEILEGNAERHIPDAGKGLRALTA